MNSSHFDSVTLAPADPILSLTEAFKADPNPDKINLSVGVFVDESGKTPILKSVLAAEKRNMEVALSKSYLPITGTPEFARLTQELCFGAADPKRIVTANTPGGTGALRVAGDFIKRNLKTDTIWLSSPTWANHNGVFTAAGLQTQSYAYFDQQRLALDYGAFIESLKAIPSGDVVVLHACCHNPTGADLSAEQWKEVAAIAQQCGWIPLLDFAYQGFGQDLETDAAAARILARTGLPLFVAQSFSKNLGLYADRVGALHAVTASEDEFQRVASQIKVAIRSNYSNPPAHGGATVVTILSDQQLRQQWVGEVEAMKNRIHHVREQFVNALQEAGVSRDFSFLKRQQGMFSFTGLTKEQAIELRQKHSIYIVDSGRINVAGITDQNLPRLAATLKAMLG